MPRKHRSDPLAKLEGGVAVAALARQQMQEPETTGEKADPLEVCPAVPDIVVVPAVPAGHVAEAWYAAMERHVLANHVGAVAELANGPLERPFVGLVHVCVQMTMPMARARSARPSSLCASATVRGGPIRMVPPDVPDRTRLAARPMSMAASVTALERLVASRE